MKRSDPASRLHWPRDGVAVRVPPRRLAGVGARCDVIAFTGDKAQLPRAVDWDALGAALPRGARVVLLVAAEDVSFTEAAVPALSGMRLREALPNLVEERTVGDVGSLHVALGESAADGSERTLAVIERSWLAAIQAHVVRTGHRVAAIVPDSLAVPRSDDGWSLAAAGEGIGARHWLRTGAQHAMPLPGDPASAVALVAAMNRQAARTTGGPSRPAHIDLYTAGSEADDVAAGLGTALGLPVRKAGGDPFVSWLAGGGPDGRFGAPLSLLAFDSGSSAGADWRRWRLAAALLVAIVGVQVAGLQWEWAGLRREAAGLRQQANTTLTTAFPDTRVVLDAPLQMSRGLAGLRASSGRSDPADFSTMMAASARIFAALPSNAMRGAEYEARVLRLRFAPGVATAPDERERLVAQALQEGYALRFEGSTGAATEAVATLRIRGAA